VSNPNVVGASPGQWYDVPTYTRVAEACDDKTDGHWRCLTHDSAFNNQLSKGVHIQGTSAHVMAWMCNEHGLETPGEQK